MASANQDIDMKMILKSAIAIAALSGAAALVPTSVLAGGVGVTVGIGVPVAIGVSPYGPGYVAYDDDYYYDPIFVGGAWYHGPYRWRMHGGEREFFVNGGWRRNEWRGHAMPDRIEFRNGGSFHDGRNEGFGDAARINARFRPGGDMHDDRRDLKDDRRDMKDDRQDVRQDRRDMREDRHDGDQHDGDQHDGDRPHN
jgi:hypothetical protein